MPPQARHCGSSSPARTRASASSIGARRPHSQHITRRMLPCTSTTSAGRLAGALVQLVDVLGDERVQLAAPLELDERAVAGVRLGASTPANRGASARRPCAPRVGEIVLDRRLLLGGGILASTRRCGPRKSGMPDSVEMPAPVSTTTRAAASTRRRASSIGSHRCVGSAPARRPSPPQFFSASCSRMAGFSSVECPA